MTTLIPKFDLKNGGSTPTGAVNRDIQSKLSDIVSVFDFMTPAQIADVQAGTTLIDVTDAVQNALNCTPVVPSSYAPTKTSLGGGRVTILFPSGVYSVSSTLDCSQRDYQQLIGEGRAEIRSSSTEYIIDMSSTDHCVIENIAFYSSTARVGIYIDRCTSAPFVQFNTYNNVAITLTTNTSANGGNGRFGIWNGRGELNVFTNLIITSDLTMFATNTADAAFPPTQGTLQTAFVTSVQDSYIACQFITHTVNTPCIVMKGCIAHEFYGCYWRTNNTSSGPAPYAILSYGITGCKFAGTVETLPSFMLVQQSVAYSNHIDISIQNNFDGRGIIACEDVAAAVGFINGYVSINTSGVIPAGTAVIKGSAFSLSNNIKGNTISALVSIPPVIAPTGQAFGNMSLSDAGLDILAGRNITADFVASPLSKTVSVPNATATTLFTTTSGFVYKVTALVLNGGANLTVTATVVNDGSTTYLLEYTPTAFMTLSISGSNVQVTQTSGSTQDVRSHILSY